VLKENTTDKIKLIKNNQKVKTLVDKWIMNSTKLQYCMKERM
jgi:hypothetical protein